MSQTKRSFRTHLRPLFVLTSVLTLWACGQEPPSQSTGLTAQPSPQQLLAPQLVGGGLALPSVAPKLLAGDSARTHRSLSLARLDAGPAATTSWSKISTLRTGSEFEILIDGIRRGRVLNREVSNGVTAVASPDGTQAAVISDFDGLRGNALIWMAAGEAPKTLLTAPVTSVAFSPDSRRLAYAVETHDSAALYVAAPHDRTRQIARVRGLDVTVLGWQEDGQALLVQVYPEEQRDAVQTAPDVLRVELASGRQTRLLASDLSRGLVYRDVRPVNIGGTLYLSAIRAPSAYPCGDQPTDLVLVGMDGEIRHSFGRTSDTYREAVWSDDGTQVAFAAQACVSRQELQSGAAAERANEVAGIYLADTNTGRATQLVRGLLSARLRGLRDGSVQIASDRLGLRILRSDQNSASPQRALSIEPETRAPGARDNRAVHIHQVFDTRDAFDGRGSCGPTSCVMNMADYQLVPNGLWVDYGGRHWSPFGLYITDSYTYGGVTYNKTKVDYSGKGAWAGAHGYMFIPGVGSAWAEIKTYLNNHTGWAVRKDAWDAAFARSQLDLGRLIVAGGKFRGLSHIVLIKGYTPGGDWIVHDPYGPRTSGGSGGADQIYRVGVDMDITHMVSN